jgi:hypothetical protein
VAIALKPVWQRHRELVWSNPDADDAVWIRSALIRPRFSTLLDIAREFGLERIEHEWDELRAEPTPEILRAEPIVTRILANIKKGFADAASGR